MITRFNSIVYKANKRGTGFVRLPEDRFTKNDIGKQLKIFLRLNNKTIELCPKVCYYLKIGFYIPTALCNKYSLINNEISFSCEEVEGFISKVGYDGRIYLPNELGKNLKLEQ